MGIDQQAIRDYIGSAFAGVDVQVASRDDGAPEIAWGDTFFIYDPDRTFEGTRRFPFATIVTKDYGDFDNRSNLDRPDVYRLNIGVSKATYSALFPAGGAHDFTALDAVMPHPVYGVNHWLCVLNPSAAMFERLKPMLAEAYEIAVRRARPRGRNARRSSQSRSNP